MKRSSSIALCFSSAALLFGMGGVITPPKPTSQGSQPAVAAMTTRLSGGLVPARMPQEPMTIIAKPDRTTTRYTVTDFRRLPGGEKFEAVNLNERGDVLGVIIRSDRSLEGPGLGFVSNRVQMLAGTTWALFRQNRFVSVVEDAPEGYLHTAAQNDRGQVLLMTGPRGRRGRVDPQPGDLTFQIWENGVMKPMPIAEDVRRAIGREATTGMLALNSRGQVVLSSGRDVLAWSNGSIHRLNYRYILGFNNQGYTVGNPVTVDSQTGRQDMILDTVLSEVSTGTTRPMESGKDIILDLNDQNQALCSLRRNQMGADRDRFYLLSNGKQIPLGVVGNAITARMNNRGQAVLGKYLCDRGKLYDLETLVPAGSPWKFQYVMDINDRGEILMRAFNVTERIPRSLLLRPTTSPATGTTATRDSRTAI
jgi:hypothetical protein